MKNKLQNFQKQQEDQHQSEGRSSFVSKCFQCRNKAHIRQNFHQNQRRNKNPRRLNKPQKEAKKGNIAYDDNDMES